MMLGRTFYLRYSTEFVFLQSFSRAGFAGDCCKADDMVIAR